MLHYKITKNWLTLKSKLAPTRLGKILDLFRQTFKEFNTDNCMKLSAALSYYTIFSLPPLLIIIISLCGIIFGKDAVNGEIVTEITGLVGKDVAVQLQNLIKNIALTHLNTVAAFVGFLVLLIGASGVFSEIQSSLNYIWGIGTLPKKGALKYLKSRLMSFSMIGSVSFLLMVSLLMNSLISLLNKNLSTYFPKQTLYLFDFFNLIIVFLITTFLFTLIFKTLPDGKITWKDSLIGASFTALLFMIGKYIIGVYLTQTNLGNVYGAAGSIVIVLVWVYYSAIILYYGAEFTKIYAYRHGQKITPNAYSFQISKPDSYLKKES